MVSSSLAGGSMADLTVCDREPIRIPGTIQQHGILLALDEHSFKVLQTSENLADLLDLPAEAILELSLEDFYGGALEGAVRSRMSEYIVGKPPVYLQTLPLPTQGEFKYVNVIVHRTAGALIVELEAADSAASGIVDLYPLAHVFIERIGKLSSLTELCQAAAEEIRALTGFDRALVYQFNADWNGNVIAEDNNGLLPSYLGHRFPASDIPRQARELYRMNRQRLIADSHSSPVSIIPEINPQSGAPLDLGFATLRSVSPIHVEYMRNMGTPASMSISILYAGELWGLISCHHHEAKRVPYPVRTACDFLTQILSLQLAAKEQNADNTYRVHARSLEARLLVFMANEENFVDGLVNNSGELMEMVGASGVAVVFGGKTALVGSTPSADQVGELVRGLSAYDKEGVFSADALSEYFPAASDFQEQASGILSIAISELHKSYVVWFRPEVIQTVNWGGDPRKPAHPDSDAARLHPRKSFELWKEIVRGHSLPWHKREVEAAAALRHAVVGLVLRKAEEVAELTMELERSNKELEAFSYSVSHDLRAPFRHIVGYAELLREEDGATLSESGRRFVDTIIESGQYGGTLVDNLLSFSQMGRYTLNVMTIDMNILFDEVRRDVEDEGKGRKILWTIYDLPCVSADLMTLRLAVRNLLSNAVKYTRNREEASIEIGIVPDEDESIFFVRDNGIGFDMRYSDKLFGVFQRLHRMEDFEGTGIGLANARRIVARHGGRTWADGAIDLGATFYFSLPKSLSRV